MLTNSSWTNGRRKFRLWRHSRPFWGGLLLILAGIELFASANMDLSAIQFHLGPEGFLSYLLPVLLLACGLLVWLTPQQRAFYAIIGTLTAVYALVGLNLGGFLLGTLIGMVGGGLSFAWAPVTPADAPPREAAAGSDAGDHTEAPASRGRHQSDADDAGSMTGRNVDDPAAPTPGAHRSNLAVSVGVPILLAATLVTAVTVAPGRAVAAPTPCPTTPAAPAAPPAAAPPAAPLAPPPAAPAAAPSAASTPTPTSTTDGAAMTRPPTLAEILFDIQHNIIDAWVEFWAKVFGIPLPTTTTTPTPTPTSTTAAAASTPTPTTTQPAPVPTTTAPPAPTSTGGPAPTTTKGAPAPTECPTTTTSGSAGTPSATPSAAPKAAPLAAGQPTVAETPATLTASTQILAGFSFDGVATLPTASGSIQALQFSATRATSVDFTLESASGGRHSLSINSNPLVVSGTVTLFATEFQGTTTILGIPLTLKLDPANPPPITFPDMTFTDVTIQLAFLDTTSLEAPTLAQTSN
jgi:hypothetical protein